MNGNSFSWKFLETWSSFSILLNCYFWTVSYSLGTVPYPSRISPASLYLLVWDFGILMLLYIWLVYCSNGKMSLLLVLFLNFLVYLLFLPTDVVPGTFYGSSISKICIYAGVFSSIFSLMNFLAKFVERFSIWSTERSRKKLRKTLMTKPSSSL